MKPSDVFLAVLVAVTWGLAFVASRLALDEFSPALMTRCGLPSPRCRACSCGRPMFLAGADRDQRHAVFGQFLAQSWAIAHGVPVGLSSVVVQSQALFTIGVRGAAFPRISVAAADCRHRHCRARPADDLRHRRFRFQRRRLCRADDFAGHVCDRQSVAAAGEGCCDVRPVRLALPVPPLPLLALAFAVDGPKPTWHSLAQMSLDGWSACCLSARSRPASPTGCGAGCCAIIPPPRWCRSRCWCRSSAPPHPAWCSAKPLGRCGWPEW